MRARFVFALATLVLVGCGDGALTGRRTLDAATSDDGRRFFADDATSVERAWGRFARTPLAGRQVPFVR